MELDEIWLNFTERMVQIELLQRVAKDTAKKELQKIIEYSNALQAKPEFQNLSTSLHNMTFIDAKTGEVVFYKHKELSTEDRYLNILVHKNKQYQWLLAEAYEEFEDYIENIYAYYGKHNRSFWPLNDFGNTSISELDEKDFCWYLEKTKKKKDIPHSVLERLRKEFPSLSYIEKTNKLKVDLSFVVVLIEKLRHAIVHNGGRITNKNDFIKATTKKAGIYNNGNVVQEHLELIDCFFGNDKYENMITLLEINMKPEPPFDIHICRFNMLTGFLMADAYLIYECIKSRFAGS